MRIAPKGVLLKICPLCSSEASLHTNDVGYWVKCNNKSCGISPTVETKQTDAVAKWNRRAKGYVNY